MKTEQDEWSALDPHYIACAMAAILVRYEADLSKPFTCREVLRHTGFSDRSITKFLARALVRAKHHQHKETAA